MKHGIEYLIISVEKINIDRFSIHTLTPHTFVCYTLIWRNKKYLFTKGQSTQILQKDSLKIPLPTKSFVQNPNGK